MKPCIVVSVEFLPAEKGGRNAPVYLKRGLYRPHFRINGEKEYIGIQFIDGPDRWIYANEVVNAKAVLLYYPDVDYKHLNTGAEFEIFEGTQIVGKGIVIGLASGAG